MQRELLSAEVGFTAMHQIVPVDVDCLISIPAIVLMVQPDHVSDLMHSNHELPDKKQESAMYLRAGVRPTGGQSCCSTSSSISSRENSVIKDSRAAGSASRKRATG